MDPYPRRSNLPLGLSNVLCAAAVCLDSRLSALEYWQVQMRLLGSFYAGREGQWRQKLHLVKPLWFHYHPEHHVPLSLLCPRLVPVITRTITAILRFCHPESPENPIVGEDR